MQFIGFNFTKISGERFKGLRPDLSINSDITITDVKKQDIDMIKDSQVVSFEFDLKIVYDPKIAELSFSGVVLFAFNDSVSKSITDSWKDKKVPEEIRIPLFNLIMNKCTLKALQIEDEFNLPLHIRMPQLVGSKTDNADSSDSKSKKSKK